MNFLKKIEKKLNEGISTEFLVRLALIVLIVFLAMKTWSLWSSVLSMICEILSPFITVFIIAYILSEPVNWLENHHIRRAVSIPCIYVLVLVFFICLVSSIVPMVISRTGDLLNSVTGALSWLNTAIRSNSSKGYRNGSYLFLTVCGILSMISRIFCRLFLLPFRTFSPRH